MLYVTCLHSVAATESPQVTYSILGMAGVMLAPHELWLSAGHGNQGQHVPAPHVNNPGQYTSALSQIFRHSVRKRVPPLIDLGRSLILVPVQASVRDSVKDRSCTTSGQLQATICQRGMQFGVRLTAVAVHVVVRAIDHSDRSIVTCVHTSRLRKNLVKVAMG